MKRFFGLLVEITKDALHIIQCVIEDNLMNLANITNFALPYVMYFVGQDLYRLYGVGDGYVVNAVLFAPALLALVIYYTKSIANKIGKGITVPVPAKRFTEVDKEEGMVSIDNDRVQELLLYVADLEDWLEKKGLM